MMTSNLGGEQRGEGLGFQPIGKEGKNMEALRRHFTPEFLGRLDQIVHFNQLRQKDIEEIAGKCVAQLQNRTAAVGIHLQLPEELAASIGRQVCGRGGARNIRTLVQEKVEGPLAVYLLRCGKRPTKVKAIIEKDEVIFRGG